MPRGKRLERSSQAWSVKMQNPLPTLRGLELVPGDWREASHCGVGTEFLVKFQSQASGNETCSQHLPTAWSSGPESFSPQAPPCGWFIRTKYPHHSSYFSLGHEVRVHSTNIYCTELKGRRPGSQLSIRHETALVGKKNAMEWRGAKETCLPALD